ncbi:MAG: hypothetical protein E6G89_19025 [Alphaproteobacteria bacterium]|nr:MAG: hypothetical protein E6G89_19025 [Alphaproteobacteria bacterium]
MNRIVLRTVFVLLAGAGAAAAANAATVPCENVLKQLRDAEKTAALGDADKAKVAELENKGIERCNADDDKRADTFFEDALKIVAKK